MSLTNYQRRVVRVWIVQVRNKGSNEMWTPTGLCWFNTRRDALDDIENGKCDWLEYRAASYVPESL